jgi:phage-related protein
LPVQWRVTFVSQRLESELLELSSGFVARLIRYAERMEEFGPDLGMPHTRAMGGGLFELRIKAPERIARIFYCVTSDRRIVFLHQFVKKSQETPAKELRLARRRMKEVGGG